MFLVGVLNPFEKGKMKIIIINLIHVPTIDLKHQPGNKASSTHHDSKNSFAALPSALTKIKISSSWKDNGVTSNQNHLWWNTHLTMMPASHLAKPFPAHWLHANKQWLHMQHQSPHRLLKGLETVFCCSKVLALVWAIKGRTSRNSQDFAGILGFCLNLPSNISNQNHFVPWWQIGLRNRGGIGAFVQVKMMPWHTWIALHWGKGQLWLLCLLSFQRPTSGARKNK